MPVSLHGVWWDYPVSRWIRWGCSICRMLWVGQAMSGGTGGNWHSLKKLQGGATLGRHFHLVYRSCLCVQSCLFWERLTVAASKVVFVSCLYMNKGKMKNNQDLCSNAAFPDRSFLPPGLLQWSSRHLTPLCTLCINFPVCLPLLECACHESRAFVWFTALIAPFLKLSCM